LQPKHDNKNKTKENLLPQPIREEDGFVDRGPRNILLDQQNQDILVPPVTDHGTVPNLNFRSQWLIIDFKMAGGHAK
jgi:hypothetical protein